MVNWRRKVKIQGFRLLHESGKFLALTVKRRFLQLMWIIHLLHERSSTDIKQRLPSTSQYPTISSFTEGVEICPMWNPSTLGSEIGATLFAITVQSATRKERKITTSTAVPPRKRECLWNLHHVPEFSSSAPERKSPEDGQTRSCWWVALFMLVDYILAERQMPVSRPQSSCAQNGQFPAWVNPRQQSNFLYTSNFVKEVRDTSSPPNEESH